MNFNNQRSNDQHPSDEIIDRELRALREAPSSAFGIGDAIKTMQSSPSLAKKSRLRWPIGVGSLAAAGGALVLGISLSTGKAYARELHEISTAQEKQKMVYSKSVIFQGKKEPERVLELWIDHNKETFRQYTGSGTLDAVNVCDGSIRYSYYAGDSRLGVGPSASIEADRTEHTTVETVEAMLQSEFFRKHKIEKTSGVTLNGKKCDYYNFANGYYRLWVDPATKLPLQREIYDKGVTLWERDTYDYPASIPQDMFGEPKIQGVKFFDYPTARRELASKLEGVIQTQKVGGISISLRAVVRDETSVSAVWTSSNGETAPAGIFDILAIEGTEPGTSYRQDTGGLPYRGEDKLLTQSRRFEGKKSFRLPLKVKIAVWKNKKLVGWASFTVGDVQSYPSLGQLLATPAKPGVSTATTEK